MAKDFTRADLENTSFDWMPDLANTMRAWSQEDEEIANNLQSQARNPGGGEEWTGDGGQAAQDKAHGLSVPIASLADTRAAVADLIDKAHQPFVENRQKILDQVAEIEKPVALILANGHHYDLKQLARVGDDWKIQATPEAEAAVANAPVEDKNDLVQRIQQMAQQDTEDLQERLREFKDADDSWTGQLTPAAHLTDEDLQQLAQQSNPLLEETPEQARQDVQDYLEGHASAEEMARVQAASSLTPEQQQAFKDGKLQLPTQQAMVLQQLSDQLKGKSDADITKMASTLPGGNAIANAEQLYSNPRVSSGLVPGADGKPETWQGGFDKLATDTQRTLSAPVAQWTVDGVNDDGTAYAHLEYPTKDGLASVTERANLSDKELRQGSFVDGAISTKAAELLHVQEHPESVEKPVQDDSKIIYQQHGPQHDQDPLIQDMLNYASTDHQSTHDLVAGTDGQHRNDQFLKDLASHTFSDHGQAAGALFSEMSASTDPTNPNVGLHQATNSGETAHALATYLADHKADLGDLGKNNPGLLQGAAELEKHYIPAMLGEQESGKLPDSVAATAGFASMDQYDSAHGQDTGKHLQMRNLFGVLSEDPQAKNTIEGAALFHQKALEAAYAASLIDNPRDPNLDYLENAGAISGIVNKLEYDEALKHHQGEAGAQAAAAQEAKNNLGKIWDTTKTLGGPLVDLLPYGKQGKMAIDILSTWLKDPVTSEMAGQQHGGSFAPDSRAYDQVGLQYRILQALQSHGGIPDASFLRDHGFLDDKGNLKPIDQLPKNPAVLDKVFKNYWEYGELARVRRDASDASDSYSKAYS